MFAVLAESLVEVLEDRIVCGGSESGQVEDAADGGSAAADVSLAAELAAVAAGVALM